MCNTDARPDAAIATRVTQIRKFRADSRLRIVAFRQPAKPFPITRSFDADAAGCYDFGHA